MLLIATLASISGWAARPVSIAWRSAGRAAQRTCSTMSTRMPSISSRKAKGSRAGSPQESVAFILTTPDKRHLLERQPDLPLTSGPTPGTLTIEVDPDKTYQRMEGFGAAMTESSAWLIRTKLPAARRDQLMRKLFDPAEGIGL